MSEQEKKEFEVGEIHAVVHDKRVTRRDVLKGAAAMGAVAAFGSVAAACGSDESGGEASPAASGSAAAGTPKKGGDLKVGIGGGSAKDTLDAQVSTTETQIDYQFMLYDSLMGWDPTHTLVMLLAEEYSPNADGSVHTVKLKPDLTFHDGSPVNADAVVYSFQRILDPKTAAVGKDQLTGLTASGIKKIDDLTVEFALDKPNVIFYEALAYYNNAIVPVGYDPKTAIGTGPWMLSSFTPGQQLELKANPNYWGEGPYLDSCSLVSFADPTAKLNALLGGTIDYMTLVDTAQVGTMQATPGYKVLQAKTGGWNPFTMRVDVKPFDDERVRQAFRLIVDRQQMIDQAKGGYSWVGNDMYSPFDPGYPKDLAQREQDLEQAKSLLKQAGYDGDLNVELICSTATGAGDVQAAQVFAQQAKGAGVTVKVKQVDPSVFYGDDYLKWVFAMDFWGYRNYLPQAAIGSYPGGVWNETHWDDAEWVKLYDEAIKTVDDTRRNELIAQMETIEHEKGGYIIYQFNVLLDAYSDKLGGAIEDNWGAEAANKMRFNLMYFV